MAAPENRLKRALAERRAQFGLWLSMASPIAAEIAAQAGFDWCLIDAEHAPNELASILAQLHAIAGTPTQPIVRVPVGEERVIKQVLDLGVQTLLVPMVQSAAQAREVVRAVRYPPRGTRGVGATMARASLYSATDDYLRTADAEICVLVQAESRRALEEIAAIAATDGVDGVFIGPADLSADMGHLADPDAPEVVQAIDTAAAQIQAAGKAAGIITFDPSRLARYRAQGFTFLGVGGDVAVLAAGLRSLATAAQAAVR